jgi:hypothetical protein
LDPNNDVELWDQDVIRLSRGTLESLVDAIPRFDFAVLVLTADDLLISRGTERQAARDNVIFELGLFMGGLGRDRTFILYDRANPPKLPSDLAGVTAATFQRHASGNLQSSLGAPCTQIEHAIKFRGIRRGSILRSQIEGLKEQVNALQQRLKLAAEQEQAAIKASHTRDDDELARAQERVLETLQGFTIGGRVFHQKFGYGRITGVDGQRLAINFDVAGDKKIMANYVRACVETE